MNAYDMEGIHKEKQGCFSFHTSKEADTFALCGALRGGGMACKIPEGS